MVKKTFFTLTGIVIFLFLLERLYDLVLQGNYNIKSSYVNAVKINADVIVLGTSNSLYGFDAEVFEKATEESVYNLSSNHSSFSENLGHLYLYLKNNISPRIIFLGINPADLTLSVPSFHSYYFTAFSADPFVKKLILEEDSIIRKWYYFPFGKHAAYNEFVNPLAFHGAWQLLRTNQFAFYKKGTYKVPSGKHLFDGYENFKLENPSGIRCQLRIDDIKQLNTLLSFTKQKGIKVILYEPPYMNEVKEYINCDENNQKIKVLAEKYNYQYWMFDSLAINKKKEFFVSAFHTSPEGAKIFTKLLSQKFNKNSK